MSALQRRLGTLTCAAHAKSGQVRDDGLFSTITSVMIKHILMPWTSPRPPTPVLPEALVSDLTPCPTCQAMLRIPPDATMIRCPNCTTVLAVEPEPPSAPMAQVVAPPPLPFGRPAQARPAQATPVAPVAKYVSPPPSARMAKSAVRARLSPVRDGDIKARAGESQEEAARRAMLLKNLKRFEARERRLAERYDELIVHCRRGRIAMHLLIWGMRTQMMAVLTTAIVGVPFLAYYHPVMGRYSVWCVRARGRSHHCSFWPVSGSPSPGRKKVE